MIKTHTRLLTILFMLTFLFLFAACAAEDSGNETENLHTHVPVSEWTINRTEHWKLCTEDATPLERAKHALTDGRCTVCGAKVEENNDGSATVYQFNEKGDVILRIVYNKSGKAYRYTRENIYGEDGVLNAYKEYLNDELRLEIEYALDRQEPYIGRRIDYDASGKRVQTFNNYGDIVAEQSFDKEDKLLKSLVYHITYDDNGNILSYALYTNGAPSVEQQYESTIVDGETVTYLATETIYSVDLSKKTTTTYDKDGNPLTEVLYNIDGVVLHSYQYVYHNAEDGMLGYVQKCEGDIVWTEWIYDRANGKPFLYLCVTFDENGTPTSVTEYDEFGNEVVG